MNGTGASGHVGGLTVIINRKEVAPVSEVAALWSSDRCVRLIMCSHKTLARATCRATLRNQTNGVERQHHRENSEKVMQLVM